MMSLRNFFRSTDGSSTIEFVVLFPAFVIMLLAGVESGIMMTRNVMLERGVDIAVRDLRLGITTPDSEAELKTLVCNAAAFIPDCTDNLRLELVRIDKTAFNMPTAGVTCVEKGELTPPVTTYTAGADHDLMLLRACAVLAPFFPSTGLGLRLPKDGTGHYALVAASAFVVEPS